ncbi:DUF927 domain-containing protein [Macrococcus equipercicus]|uniref:DUF927 domain-containing protein n=1 Tax=Macrococcus equipercicus TaxID=69967 RepID=A0ABQ6RBA8_9STAP|nr:DUF927 domain-containing protein [Macrococcus equipercicus]KAA1042478.1 DUF927 domain-containing protein [Macrococcus equipercicus]
MALATKEQILQPVLQNVPDELKQLNQWIFWKAEWDETKQQFKKVPYSTESKRASSTNSESWHSFYHVESYFDKSRFDGIGFVLTKDDPFIILDLDGAFDNETGQPRSELAMEVMETTWYEISPSGTGIHAYFKGELPDNIKKKNTELDIELYSHSRFMTYTGANTVNHSICDDQQYINELAEKYFTRNKTSKTDIEPFKLNFDKTDEIDVIKVMARSKNADKISTLMKGDWEGRYNSQSDADLALVNHLAFFTGKDAHEMDSIFRSSGLYRDKWDMVHSGDGLTYGEMTIKRAIEDCTTVYSPHGKEVIKTRSNQQTFIPKPYLIKPNGHLKMEVEKGRGDNKEIVEVFISSNYPSILKRYRNIETGEINYLISFNDGRNTIIRPVKTQDITQRKELIQLARFGLDVNDYNATEIIKFIQKVMACNPMETTEMTERIGHIKNHFVIPHEDNDIELFIEDDSYKNIVDAFKPKGALLSYNQNVWPIIKEQSVVMTMVYAALASPLLKEFDVDPFIVDNSGKTSTGKTTALHVVSSVWGNDKLINSWNSSRVSIERKTSFMNSFPICMDDTRTASPSILTSVIYNHSTGVDKGRGSVRSIVKENTWNNILISTGETSLADMTEGKGGAAARIITLENSPFNEVDFNVLYKALDNDHGTLGAAFWKCYKNNEDYYRRQYDLICREYYEKSNKNEVLERLSRSFGILHLAGLILHQMPQFNHDYTAIMNDSFNSMLKTNQNIDKPKQLLENVLEYMDSHRDYILYGGSKFAHGEIIGIYKEDYLGIMPDTLKKILELEMNKTLKEWNARGYLVTDKDALLKQVRQSGRKYRTYSIKDSIIKEFGFDFQSTSSDFDYSE